MIALTRTRRPERVREADGHRVDAGLGRGVGDDVARRPHGAGARHVDDRAAAARPAIRSPISAASRNGPLRLTRDDLVEQLLGDVAERVVERRDAGVVDEHVDAAEVAVDRRRRAARARPSARRGRRTASARPPAARSAAATSSQALRLAADDDDLGAGLARRPRAIARPSPRVPPVTTATRPDRSNRSRAPRGAAAGVSWLVHGGHLRGLRFVASGPRAARAARGAPAAASARARRRRCTPRDGARVEQQVEVPEHLPDDEQRLLAHRARRPQALGDLVRGRAARRSSAASDPPAAALVVGEAPATRRACAGHGIAVAGQQPLQRHRARSAAGRPGSRTRARGRAPVGLARPGRSRCSRRPGRAGGRRRTRAALTVVDEQRVGRAVARAGPRRRRSRPPARIVSPSRQPHVGVERLGVVADEVPERPRSRR